MINWLKKKEYEIGGTLVSLIIITLFFRSHWNQKAIIAFVIFSILVYPFNWKKIIANWRILLPGTILLLAFVSELIHGPTLTDIYLNLYPLLVLPLFFFQYFSVDLAKRSEKIIELLIAFCLLIIFYCEINNIISLWKTDQSLRRITHWGWSYLNLTKSISLTGTYLMVPLSLAALFSVEKLFSLEGRSIRKAYYIFAFFSINLFIIHLSMKIGIAFLVINFAFFGFKLVKKFKVIGVSIMAILAIIMILIIGSMNYYQERLSVNNAYSENRVTRWSSIIGHYDNNIIFGMGPNKDKLGDFYLEAYKKGNQEKGVKYQFNAHNQFLEIFIQFGLIGLFLLLFLLFIMIKRSLDRRNYIYLMISILMVLVLLSVSFLQVQKGPVIFSLIYSLIVTGSMVKEKRVSE